MHASEHKIADTAYAQHGHKGDIRQGLPATEN
jgi:hypothetical protein